VLLILQAAIAFLRVCYFRVAWFVTFTSQKVYTYSKLEGTKNKRQEKEESHAFEDGFDGG
jgi:hypothetical protein